MLKKMLLLLFSLTACSAAPIASPTSTFAPDQIDLEEQAVYSALLEQMYSARAFVIMDTTATDPEGVEHTDEVLDYALQNLHEVDPETADSFRVRNEATYPLPRDMQFGVGTALISQAEKNAFFGQNQSGWGMLRESYPDTLGIVTLSRVGFDAGFDQALAYLGMFSDWVDNAGYCVLLNKRNGNWIVDQKVVTWTY